MKVHVLHIAHNLITRWEKYGLDPLVECVKLKLSVRPIENGGELVSNAVSVARFKIVGQLSLGHASCRQPFLILLSFGVLTPSASRALLYNHLHFSLLLLLLLKLLLLLAARIEYFLVVARHIVLQKGRQGQVRIGLLEDLELLNLLVQKVYAFLVGKGDECGMQTFTLKFVSIKLLLSQYYFCCLVFNHSL